MKNILYSTICAALMVSASAVAANQVFPEAQQRRQVMNQVEINGAPTGKTGVVTVDFDKEDIKIEIYTDPCGYFQPTEPGVMKCLAMPILNETLVVPLEKQWTSCGSQMFSGVKDMTMVDGPRIEIEVADHSTRMCKDLLISSFAAKASVFNPWTSETTKYELRK